MSDRAALEALLHPRPWPDLRCCPWCQRSIAGLEQGIGHRAGCPSMHRRFAAEPLARVSRRDCGCPGVGDHNWGCWLNPYGE